MNQNICNICGANYEYKNGRWICPACGAYKPEELSNEEVTLLYNASQKIRLALFDDAEEQYKDIVSKYPNNPDGYWGLVLAKYGIKYEQDYDGKMIPSCYAASYESVLTDKNYLKAVELADKDNRKYYEEQANKIEKIRKEWIDKASKEEPYDIFISYKDTEKENGTERTKDSYDALELYTMLSKLGYRVFYSRESLKDKTGEKYEPYIFNALNTAHIMIVYGSKPEYIESTWIKNEWMRFYKRIKLGKKQPNALLVINNGFNPSELPSPLSKMQTLDRTRLDFSRELEEYCKRVIKAATTVLPKIERVEVKAKQGKVGKIVKIDAVELNNKTTQKPEIVREEVEKREIGNYTVSKLTASAENELKIAEMQLSTANFDEAGKRFNTFLLKNPKNGRALTGKFLAENKSKDLNGFSSSGVQNFADWKLLEQVLLFSEKSVSEKILKSLCDEVLRSFNTGDFVRAKDIYSQVSAYEDSAVTEMRKSVCDLAKGLIGKNDDTAKYFFDGYLLYEQDEDKFLSQIRNIVGNSIEKNDFNFAKKYSEDWLKYENYDLSANYSALKIKYKVKTIAELFTKTESNNAYSEIDDILHCLNEESAAACFKDICDRVNTLLSAGNSAKQVYSYIDKFFRYIFDGRAEKIKQFLTFITNKPSKEFTSVFGLLLSLSDFNTEEYSLYTLRFADTALKNGDFDLADKYYDKVNELHETALSWEGKLKCRLKVKNDIEYSANIQNLTDFKIIENILSLSENDGKRYEFLSRIAGYVYSALKTSKTDTAKLVAVFENLLSYVPKDFDDKIIEWLFKFARFLKDKGEFDLAEKLYAMIVNYDAENHVAYWEMLQAKLHCKDEQGVIKQYNLISDFQEFQNALLASANNDSALRHYIDIQNKQKTWVEQDKQNKIKAKKRKKVFKVACIIFAIFMIAIAGVFGGLSYYNSENILKYNSVDGGLSVYAGKFYKADGTLIIPQVVDGKTVTEISANAFENHTEIKKVIIPTTVNAIRESAFSGCVNLESVEFNNISEASANTQANANENNGISLFSAQTYSAVNTTESIKLSVIGARAFKGCEKLQTFELNYGLKTIGEEAFSGSGLKEIAIPETVEFVGKNVFENCNSLTVIEVCGRSKIPQNWDNDWNKGHENKVEYSIRIVFDYNGADRPIKTEQYVVYDKAYNFPVPTKEGYTFVGWYRGDTKLTGKDGVSLSDWNYTDGGSVKAEFTANENTLFFNGNGATDGDMPSQKIHTAENVNLNANGFTKAGYTFTGWSTSANGTKVYNDGALYTMGKNSSYVLYAVWQANTNTLHFDANGGSGMMADKKIATDSTAVLSTNTFTRNGYSFVGWATDKDGSKVYDDSATYTMGTEVEYTLYAIWTLDSYTISYALNSGHVETINITDYNIETDSFTLNNPTRIGYSFVGWSGTDLNGQQIVVTITKGSFGNRSYTANWQANTNTLHFDANGGSGTMADKKVNTDSTTTLPTNIFTRSGYSFVGWATSADGSKIYNDNADYSMGTDAEYTLYAIWSVDYLFSVMADGNIKILSTYLSNSSIDVPEYIDGHKVAVIGENAFKSSTISSINLPTSIIKIEQSAFEGCNSLTSIDLPQSLLYIEKKAFFNSGLETIVIPENVIYIKSTAFNCDSLSTIYYNATSLQSDYDSSYTLAARVFYGCTFDLIIGNHVINIPSYLFAGCSINSITFTSNSCCTTISGYAFRKTTIQNYIAFPSSLTNIGSSAFKDALFGTPVYLPKTITSLGYDSFGFEDNRYNYQIPYFYCEGDNSENYSNVFGYYPWSYNKVILGYKFGDVIFKANGGSGTMANQTIGNGNTATLKKNEFSKQGYTFKGWSKTQDGAVEYLDQAQYNLNFINGCTLYAVWEITIYSINYNLNNGNATNITSYNINTAKFTLNNPSRNGYSFTGWSGTDISGTSMNVTIESGSVGNRSYTANWEIINYNLSYDLAGGSVSSANLTTYNVATNTFTLNNPTRTGYKFMGWSGTGISGTSSSVSISKGSIGNRSYTANWQIIEYTVSYSLAGGSVSGNMNSYTVEDSFTLINPTRAGYTFIGWSGTDIDGTLVAVTVAKGSIGNRSYSANWQANLNVIILTDGTSSVQATGYTDEYARLPANTFVKENHEFKGWATTQGGDVAYYDRDLYPVGTNSSYTLYAVWEDRTGWIAVSNAQEFNNIRNNLSANYYLTNDIDLGGVDWTPIGENSRWFTGKLDGNGKTVSNFILSTPRYYKTEDKTPDTYRYYTLGLFSVSEGIIDNLSISNWEISFNTNFENSGGQYSTYYELLTGGIVGYNNGTLQNCKSYCYGDIFVDKNIHYYVGALVGWNAYQIINSFSDCFIDFNGNLPNVDYTYGWTPVHVYCYGNFYFGGIAAITNNGGSIVNSKVNLHGINNIIINHPNTSKTVSVITSCRNGNVSSCFYNSNFGPGYHVTATESEELIAPYERYIRYFDGEYMNDYQNINAHEIVKTRDCKFTKDGYTFIGWSLSDGGAVKYHAGGECFIPLDKTSLTLYPVWQANTNDVIFNANGGSGEMSNQQIQTDATAKLSANVFTKTGYHFIGWATSPDGQVEFRDKADYTMGVNSSYTLYAVWEQNTNEIIFNANGGSGTMANQQALTNTVVTINQCTFTAPMGYYFAGWSEDPNGSADYTDGALFSVGTNSAYKLYAIWAPFKFTITLDAQGGEIANDSMIVDYGSIPNLEIPSLEHYEFGGWCTAIGGSGAKCTDENGLFRFSYEYLGDIMVYAYWKCKTELEFSVTNNEVCSITGITDKTIEELYLPIYYNGYTVTNIAANAFKDCSSLKTVYIPETYLQIGEGAFKGCSSLETITLPFIGQSRTASIYQATFGWIFGYDQTKAVDAGITSGTKTYGTEFNVNALNHAASNSNGGVLQYAYYNKGRTVNVSGQTKYMLDSYGYYYYIPDTIKTVVITDDTILKAGAFYNCNMIEKVYINNTTIETESYYNNNCSATFYYYSSSLPTESGNYWHYGLDGSIVEW